ncbi:hypothetical protein IHN32_13695 [Deinococcus sp. 14RED07]|uniref:hypothetical protein n=1 Tax=Deinococcus sp. 14RED07 TaxID=2745874 RepID=UPI001E3C4D4D|nr:hypothetical protein [Deinococcus sp. 14RED07]MCD0176998.1 hypothetical protein [Deinococcus sp. 14RED07]
MNLNEVLGPECWNMQADGSALSPLSGVKVCVTHGGERALLELRSGWRKIFDARRGGLLIAPAVRVVEGVTLRAVSARAWRDESLVVEAAALRTFGSGCGVFGRPDWAPGEWSLSAEDDAGRWVNVRRALRDREAAERAARRAAEPARLPGRWSGVRLSFPLAVVAALLAAEASLVRGPNRAVSRERNSEPKTVIAGGRCPPSIKNMNT